MLYRTLLAAAVLCGFSAAANAACTPSTSGAIGSPFATPGVTRLDTQTSDAVKFTGGCIEGPVINGQTYYAPAYRGATSKSKCTWADGDTTHDVGDCIKAAVAAASANGGGAVVVPPGSYGMSTCDISIPSQVRVRGAGARATTLNALSGCTGTMFTIGTDADTSPVRRAGLGGMTLDGESIAASALKVRSAQEFTVSDFLFQGATTYQLDMDVATTDIAGVTQGNIDNGAIVANGSEIGWRIGPGTGNNDTHHNSSTNVAITGTGTPFDFGAADSNIWVRFRATTSGAGRPVFRAGTGGGAGWFRRNVFFGATIGGNGTGQLLVETGIQPSANNSIYGFKKGGNEPDPELEADTELFCIDTEAKTCTDTTPFKKFKYYAPVINKTSEYTITSNNCGTSYNNRAGSGEQIFNLPAASGEGCRLFFNKYSAGSKLTVTAAGTDVVSGYGTNGTTAAGGSVYTKRAFASLLLEDQQEGVWVVKSVEGPWFTSSGGAVAAGGLTVIETVVASASSTLAFTDIPSGFNSLKLVCDALVPSADGVTARLQVGTGATPTWEGADYTYAVFGHNTAGAATPATSTTAAGVQINSGTAINQSTTNPLSFTAYIRNPGSAAANKTIEFQASYENDTPVHETVIGSGKWTGAQTAITAVRFAFPSNNVTSGQCSLYGLVP